MQLDQVISPINRLFKQACKVHIQGKFGVRTRQINRNLRPGSRLSSYKHNVAINKDVFLEVIMTFLRGCRISGH